jgi:hypothetical protein
MRPLLLLAVALLAGLAAAQPPADGPRTEVAIRGDKFLINGRPTYQGRTWNGKTVEGLLLNSRMVQATFDDLNPDTRASGRTRTPRPGTPTGTPGSSSPPCPSGAARLLAVTSTCRGAAPRVLEGQPWHNSASRRRGPAAGVRWPGWTVLDRADELGMVVILGLFYFGQDERLADEDAVRAAVNNAVDWLIDARLPQRPDRDQQRVRRPVRPRPLETGTGPRADRRVAATGSARAGGSWSAPATAAAPSRRRTSSGRPTSSAARQRGQGPGPDRRDGPAGPEGAGYRPMPVLFNEDDHFDFDKPTNNFAAAVGEYASWGGTSTTG